MIKRFYTFLVSIVLILTTCTCADAYSKPDTLSFSDFSGIISDGVKDYVKSRNKILFEKTSASLIFVVAETENGINLNNYAKKLYSAWEVGKHGRGNSVLVVISSNNNEYSIIQGKNIKGALSDSVLYKILSEDFEPHFATGDYDKAVITLYNSLGRWYENQYEGLSLMLDDNLSGYSSSLKTKDLTKNETNLLLWIAASTGFIMIIVFFNVKRKVDFKHRQHERKIKRKRNSIDIDKIVNM